MQLKLFLYLKFFIYILRVNEKTCIFAKTLACNLIKLHTLLFHLIVSNIFVFS